MTATTTVSRARATRLCVSFGLLAALFPGCVNIDTPVRHTAPQWDRTGITPWTTTDSGLQYQLLAEGDGPRAQWGDTVSIHESTALEDGTLIFSTWTSGGQPLSFTLGADQVVDGMEELVAGMRVGQKRRAIMPPAITQRQRYPDAFGPEDTLHFVVHLVATERPQDATPAP